MVERLSALDASFLYLDSGGTPLHLGSLILLEAPEGGLDEVARLVEARLSRVPRYRQRVLPVPGRLAGPVWVDDPRFDPGYHIRRSALPAPGSEEQLLALVSRVTSLPLDRRRPLWEVYLVEGVDEGRIAIVTKTHPVLVDGLSALDIAQVLLDVSPASSVGVEPAMSGTDGGARRPGRVPRAAELVGHALVDHLRRPPPVAVAGGMLASDLRTAAERFGGMAGKLLRAAGSAVFPAPSSPLNSGRGAQRRVALARLDLEQVKRVRAARGGTVNDVLLAVLSGALREFLLARGEPVVSSTTVRALVPVALEDAEGGPGGQVSAALVDLPVGEPNPRVRLGRVGYAMHAAVAGRRSVSAAALVALSGFAPPTLHALGVRAARGLSRRMFNLVLTNVPGPQEARYVGSSRVLEVFPLLPVVRGQGLAIGMTSYAGQISIGLDADRDGLGDVDLLAGLVEQELGQLVEDGD